MKKVIAIKPASSEESDKRNRGVSVVQTAIAAVQGYDVRVIKVGDQLIITGGDNGLKYINKSTKEISAIQREMSSMYGGVTIGRHTFFYNEDQLFKADNQTWSIETHQQTDPIYALQAIGQNLVIQNQKGFLILQPKTVQTKAIIAASDEDSMLRTVMMPGYIAFATQDSSILHTCNSSLEQHQIELGETKVAALRSISDYELLVIGKDNKLQVWDLREQKKVLEITPKTQVFNGIKVADYLICQTDQEGLDVYSLKTGEYLHTVNMGNMAACAMTTLNNTTLLVGGGENDGRIKSVDTQSWKIETILDPKDDRLKAQVTQIVIAANTTMVSIHNPDAPTIAVHTIKG